MRGRRWKVLSVSPELAFSVMQQTWENKRPSGIIKMARDGIPEGVVFVKADYCFLSDMFRFVISHPSFDEVPEGEMPPPVWPYFQITHGE